MKLNEALEMYLLSLEARRLSAAHTSTVRCRLARFTAIWGESDVSAIAGDDVDAHFSDLEESGLAHGTLAGYKSSHRAFWNWCASQQFIAQNPADALLVKDRAYDYRPVHSRAAPESDFQAVVNALPNFAAHRDNNPRDLRDAALVSLAIDCAKRRKELWNLRRRDIERALDRGEAVAGGRMVYHATSHGKTGQVTMVFFEETAVLLRHWLAAMPPESNWLWVNLRTGQRLRADVLNLAFGRLCAFAGVKTFRFHAVRKRSVTDIIRSTGDWKVGQLLAGHKDQRTTQLHYNDVDQQRVDEMAARLADVRRGRSMTDPAGGDGLAASFFGKVNED
jgi:integrase